MSYQEATDRDIPDEEFCKRFNAITDGFGSYWSKVCHQCGEESMEVVRPGKVQCGRCG